MSIPGSRALQAPDFSSGEVTLLGLAHCCLLFPPRIAIQAPVTRLESRNELVSWQTTGGRSGEEMQTPTPLLDEGEKAMAPWREGDSHQQKRIGGYWWLCLISGTG